MSKLPRLGPKLSAGGGWHIQGLYLANGVSYSSAKLPVNRKVTSQRGYVKIFNPFGAMIDTALTVKAARARVRMYKQRGTLC